MDGVLIILRSLREASLLSFIAFGEGAQVATCALSPELRSAAYVERKVPESARAELEEVAAALGHVVLVGPHVLPVKSYMTLLQEYAPEVAFIAPNGSPQVMVVAPSRDATSGASLECPRAVLEAVYEAVSFGGPAYRMVPSSPLVLYQLARVLELPKLPFETASQIPRYVVEAWAGQASITTELVRLGFVGRAYECYVEGKYAPEGDVEKPENRDAIHRAIVAGEAFHMHLAPG